MDDMRFEPSAVRVAAGETIRFVIVNRGRRRHEFVLGAIDDLTHAEIMKQHPNMVHHDPNMVTVDTEATGEMVWRFDLPGPVSFGCLEAEHFDAGMKGSIAVIPSAEARDSAQSALP